MCKEAWMKRGIAALFVTAEGRKQPAHPSVRDWNIHRMESSATREMTKQM